MGYVNKPYLKRVKSRNKDYLYVVVNNHYRKQILYSFGRLEDSLRKMYGFVEDGKLPKSLVDLGFTLDDLDEWILTLQTGFNASGKKLNWVHDYLDASNGKTEKSCKK